MRLVHWQDLGSVAVGVWLCVAPLFLSLNGVSAWTTAIFGLLVILFAIEGLVMPSYFEELFEALMGVALIVAPWSLGYDSSSATFNSMISGVLVAALAISEMLTDQEFLTWCRGRRPRMFA
jgi:hypothetical protein